MQQNDDPTAVVQAIPTTAIKWRNPYDEDENRFYDDLTTIETPGPSMTLQAPAEEQDINILMKRMGVKDGSRLPRWEDPSAIYGDFTELPSDPVEAAEFLRLGNNEFMMLPAEVRRNFDSAAHLYNWLQDSNNRDRAIEMGLLDKPQPTIIPQVRIIPEPVTDDTK